MNFADLHSHVLPGLDDGSPDLDTSMEMLRGLQELGFSHVAATPHQRSPNLFPSADEIAGAYAEVGGAVSSAGLSLSMSLGAENFWDDIFYARQKDNTLPCYDEGRAFLFEIPNADVPVNFENTLFNLRTRGYLPVMAHPERILGFQRDVHRLERIGRLCALVVDLGALAGHHGFSRGRHARRFVLRGLVHAVASDLHTVGDVASAERGIAWIKKKLGAKAVERLLVENPRQILTGQLPDLLGEFF